MSVQPKYIYVFDSFSVDREKRVLYRGAEPVQLTPKVFDTLLALIEDRGRILSKDRRGGSRRIRERDSEDGSCTTSPSKLSTARKGRLE